MKYPFILLLSVLLIPIVSQGVYAQNIIGEIGEALNDLTSGMMGSNDTGQSSNNASNSTIAGQSTNGSSNSNSNSTSNQSESSQSSNNGIGSIQELQNLTSGNQQILENGSSIGNNVSLLQGMEKSQLGNKIGGNQDVKFEGNVLENATRN